MLAFFERLLPTPFIVGSRLYCQIIKLKLCLVCARVCVLCSVCTLFSFEHCVGQYFTGTWNDNRTSAISSDSVFLFSLPLPLYHWTLNAKQIIQFLSNEKRSEADVQASTTSFDFRFITITGDERMFMFMFQELRSMWWDSSEAPAYIWSGLFYRKFQWRQFRRKIPAEHRQSVCRKYSVSNEFYSQPLLIELSTEIQLCLVAFAIFQFSKRHHSALDLSKICYSIYRWLGCNKVIKFHFGPLYILRAPVCLRHPPQPNYEHKCSITKFRNERHNIPTQIPWKTLGCCSLSISITFATLPHTHMPWRHRIVRTYKWITRWNYVTRWTMNDLQCKINWFFRRFQRITQRTNKQMMNSSFFFLQFFWCSANRNNSLIGQIIFDERKEPPDERSRTAGVQSKISHINSFVQLDLLFPFHNSHRPTIELEFDFRLRALVPDWRYAVGDFSRNKQQKQ